MATKRKYLPQSSVEKPVLPGVLPLDRKIAVYYRQSTMAQVGNISTDMQQIDLPKHVIALGWEPEAIILIDEDEGVSGTKRIDERKGMSRLYNLIITGGIGAVAVQAEDRLFRDETQIQVNVFIDACLKNNVRVITPYFKYNFADKYEGSYHRLLFRMRAEQAADFLHSYIRGRLFAAKERMLLQGLWTGGNINLGYMVDDRKTLPNGMANPNWRKYVPFEPCAKVVVQLFEIFVKFGGNIRKTTAHVYENGPHFPDFDDPEFQWSVPPGFMCVKPLRMLKHGNVYAPSYWALTHMLTNAVYIGHWLFRDQIVQFNNHPAIVSEDLFFRAFNYLSPHTLTGDHNPDYVPPFYRHEPLENREAAKPIYNGLVGSYYEGEWKHATPCWSKGMQAYAYVVKQKDVSTNYHTLWSRRCDYFDEIVTEMLHTKLRATFDDQVWSSVLSDTEGDFETEQRVLTQQHKTITQRMEAILTNMMYVQLPILLEGMQKEYQKFAQEQKHVEQKLATLERRVHQQEARVLLAKQAENVLANWHKMPLKDKHTVAHAFITRIIVTPTGALRVADAEILWRDNSRDTFKVPYRADKWVVWQPEEVETLTRLVESKATQVEISCALPQRNWRAIRIKIYELTGTRSFHIAPKVIRDEEKYGDYLARLERREDRQRHTGSARWREDDMKRLEELLVSGATQLEIAAALPYRSWQAIRRRVIMLKGRRFNIPETGHLEDGETYQMYVSRTLSPAEAMEHLVEESLERQMLQNKKHHRSGLRRLNVVVLMPSSILRAS